MAEFEALIKELADSSIAEILGAANSQESQI